MERPKVLIVDDRPANILSMEAVLDSLDIDILSANSGKEALEVSYKAENLALILLDVQMPEMDGFETAEYLKRVKKTREVPIIFVTAISKEDRHVFKGYSSGCVDYFFKPFDPHTLISKVKIFLELNEGKNKLFERAEALRKTVEDLSNTKRKLKKSRNTLDKAQELARMGSWSLDLRSDEFTCSSEVYSLLGLTEEESIVDISTLLSFNSPDDKGKLKDKIDKALSSAEPFTHEHRIITKDKSQRVIYERGDIFYNDQNEPEYLIGTMQDVTEWRKIEGRLNLTEEVLKNASEGVLITDSESTIISVNPAFTRITGHPPEEAIGFKPNILKSDHHDDSFYKEMWKELADQGSWHGEIWNRRKNGEPYPEILSIRALYGQLGEVINYIAIFTDISGEKQTKEELRYQAEHDALTELPNRNLFMDRLQQALTNRPINSYLAVIIFGLDDFKIINDSLGPSIGDELLCELAGAGQKKLPEGYSFSRLGGDEFALLVRNIDSTGQLVTFIEHLSTSLFCTYMIPTGKVHIGASMGIAVAPNDGEAAEDLFKKAGIAMHRAKKEKKGKTQFFADTMDKAATYRLHLENEMRASFEKEEFYLVYQPKISLAENRVVGMEALVRWKHHEMGFIGPAEFIPLAEEIKLVIPLGAWILKKACEQTKEWIDAGYDLKVSVNISAIQFQDENLINLVENTLRNTRLKSKNLELEITESVLMHDTQGAIDILESFKKQGLTISMDDFGTGYSSLSYLKKLPIDILKIDQSFIRNLLPNNEDAAIVSTIIAMAKKLNLTVIAEGVETKAHVDYLIDEKCDQIQGYYYSKPLAAVEFKKYLLENYSLVTVKTF
ncbi:MAG: EAL domain-containing protein [Desulfobulbaceae bacterium]|nr:EAL domain-containing protein [Desulfobulbaceae bacterium]